MTPVEARKKAFEYERTHPDSPPSLAFMQGFLYAQQHPVPVPVKEEFIVETPFDTIWRLYDRKDNKQSALKAWNKLSATEKQRAYSHIPEFVLAHPDKKYRPMLSTYINQKRFNDEEIIDNGTQQSSPSAERLQAYQDVIARVGRQG